MKTILSFIFVLSISTLLGQDLKPTDYLSKDFHADRRAKIRADLPANSVAVFFANPVRNRANDVDYMYHQDPDFYYLTGYKEPNAVLLILSEDGEFQLNEEEEVQVGSEILFVQERNEQAEMWTGRRLGIEGAKNELGLQTAFNGSAFAEGVIDFDQFKKVFFLNLPDDLRDSNRDEADLASLIGQFKEDIDFPEDYNRNKFRLYDQIKSTDIENSANVAQTITRWMRYDPTLSDDEILTSFQNAESPEERIEVAENIPDSRIDGHSLNTVMDMLREEKTAEEMKLLKKAVEISCVGQNEVMKAMHPKMSETEVQGIHEFVFKKYGSEYEGYPSIVGAGNNGCVLHYIENDRQEVGNQLVLMDLGAEYHGYTADVTRTIPANGKFTKEQRLIYDIVYDAQQAAFEKCIVGNRFRAPHDIAREIINERLTELGLIDSVNQRHRYFPHGTSHYLGLDVHDRGTGGEFKHNTVITVEPGIYIPIGSDCDEKWWGISVRIEDDILITNDGWTNLSGLSPRTADAIEAMMAKKSALDDFELPSLD